MGADLMEACEKRDLDKLKQLLKSSHHLGSINDLYSWPGMDWMKATALSYACNHNTHDFIELLLGNGARDDIKDSTGFYAIHWACLKDTDTLAKVKLLVERNVDNIARRNKEQKTPLMLVKDHDTLEYLLQNGARVNDVDNTGQTALYWASYWHRPANISMLLKYGADVNLSNNNGDTPLHIGAKEAYVEIIKVLVSSPACDIYKKNKKGQTALDMARSKPWSTKDYTQVIEYLKRITS